MVETPSYDDDEPLKALKGTETPPTSTELIAALQEEGPTEENGKMVGLWLEAREVQDDASGDPIKARVETQLDLARIYLEAGGNISAGKTLHDAKVQADQARRLELAALVQATMQELGYSYENGSL